MARFARRAALAAALAVSVLSVTPGAALAAADKAHPHHMGHKGHKGPASVTVNCDHCTINRNTYIAVIGNGNHSGNGSHNDSDNGNGNGNGAAAEEGLPGIGFPIPNDAFFVSTSPSVQFPGLVRVSQSGDVEQFFPYPPVFGPNTGLALERITSQAVYRTQDDRGHVTITVDAQSLTCAADGTLQCTDFQAPGRRFEISQRF